MRKSKDIALELEAKRMAVEGMTDAAQIDAANDEIKTLCREMETALNLEAVARLQAQRSIITPSEEKEVKRFSISKFIREARAGQLTGVEAEMCQEGLEEMRRAGQTSQNNFAIPSCVLRTFDVNNVSTATELSLFSNKPLEEKNVTAEVTPNHLWFDDRDYAELGNKTGRRAY